MYLSQLYCSESRTESILFELVFTSINATASELGTLVCGAHSLSKQTFPDQSAQHEPKLKKSVEDFTLRTRLGAQVSKLYFEDLLTRPPLSFSTHFTA